MNPYIEILRPGNAIMSAIVIILIAIIDKSFNIPIIFAMLTVFFETAAGNVINDYFDYQIDLVNKPERPIPSGRISLKNGRNYGYLLFGLGTLFGFLISYMTNNWIPFLIVLLADIVLYLYAYKFLLSFTSDSSYITPDGVLSLNLTDIVSLLLSNTLGIIVIEENLGFILYKVLSLLFISEMKLFIFDFILASPENLINKEQ